MTRPRLSEAPYLAALVVALFLIFAVAKLLFHMPPITPSGDAGLCRKDYPMNVNGNKTYATAGVAIAYAVFAYLNHTIDIAAASQLVEVAVMGTFMRHGMKTGA